MTTYCGVDGYFKAGALGSAAIVGELNHWSLSISMALNDVSVFANNGWGAFKCGVRNWTGVAEGFWDLDDAGQAALNTALMGGSGTQVECYFHVYSDKYYHGIAYVSAENVDVAVAAVATVGFDIQGNGALTLVV